MVIGEWEQENSNRKMEIGNINRKNGKQDNGKKKIELRKLNFKVTMHIIECIEYKASRLGKWLRRIVKFRLNVWTYQAGDQEFWSKRKLNSKWVRLSQTKSSGIYQKRLMESVEGFMNLK